MEIELLKSLIFSGPDGSIKAKNCFVPPPDLMNVNVDYDTPIDLLMEYAKKEFLNQDPDWPRFVFGRSVSGSKKIPFGLIKFQKAEGMTVQEVVRQMGNAGFIPACVVESLFFVAWFRQQLGLTDRIIALGSNNEKYLKHLEGSKPFSFWKNLWGFIKRGFKKAPEPVVGYPVVCGGDGGAVCMMSDRGQRIDSDYYFLAVYYPEVK